MSGVARTLLRSILRWTRQPHVKHTPFKIDVAKVVSRQRSLQHLPRLLPAGLERATLHDAMGVRAAALLCYRMGDISDKRKEGDMLDTMFAVIKHLNSRSGELKAACNSREYRSSSDVLQHAKIRVGQVVQHKELGFRGICIGWTTNSDGKESSQRLSLLVDWFDLEELLDGEFPSDGAFIASEFSVLPDGPQSRISHQMIPKYFCRYDSAIGAYIPNKFLNFQYPFDICEILSKSGMFYWPEGLSRGGKDVHSPSELPHPTSNADECVGTSIKHEEWKANEVYLHHQESLLRASSEVLKMMQNLSTDIVSLLEPAVGGDDDDVVVKSRKEILKEVLELSEELKRGVFPTLPSRPNSSTKNSDKHIANLLKQLKLTPDEFLQDATEARNKISHILKKPDEWDENTVYPLSAEQMQYRKVVYSIRILTSLFSTIEQLLVLRFQNLSGRVSEFEQRIPGAVGYDDPVLPAMLQPPVKYRLGQVLRHKKFGYRGVCAGWDIRPVTDTSKWEGVIGLRHGQEQPFYRIIPDQDDVSDFLGSGQQRDFYYVAQDNLEAVTSIVTDKDSICSETDSNRAREADKLLTQIKKREIRTIRNNGMTQRFGSYNEERGLYDAKDGLQFCFSLLPNTPDSDIVEPRKALAHKNCEEALLRVFRVLNDFFLTFHTLSAESHVLSLLKHALSRDDAQAVEAFLWIVSMSSSNTPCAMLMREGMAVLSRGDYTRALKLFINASREEPTFAEAYSKAGGIHATQNEHITAVTFTTLALQRNPRHFGALAGQGFALAAVVEENGDYTDALAALKNSLEINPWASHVSSRYTALLHETELKECGALKKKNKEGSLSVVHLTSDESLEELSDDETEEGNGDGDNSDDEA